MVVRGIGAGSGTRRPHVHAHPERKLNDIDPRAWLADVLARIAYTPQTKLAELLPWKWRLELSRKKAA
jgi:IS66 C-terminal element